MDNIPGPDSDFLTMSQTLRTAIAGNLGGYGFVAGDSTSLTSAINSFDTSLTNETAASTSFNGAHALKLTNRAALEVMVRNFIQRIYAKVGISDGLITGAGLRLKD